MGKRLLSKKWCLPALGAGWMLSLLVNGGASEAGAAVYTTGCANASECTFQELLGGGRIFAGGQRFGQFAIEKDPGSVDWTKVVVRGRDDMGLSPGPGIEFLHNGEVFVVDADFMDIQFSYVIDPVITPWNPVGNELELVTQSTSGSGRVEVDETVFSATRRAIGDKTVESDPAFDENRALDAIGFAPQQGLLISNSIVVESDAVGDSALLDGYIQRFELTVVPEPGVGAMTSVGAGALVLLGWKSKRRSGLQVEARPGHDENKMNDGGMI
jgi:hypothetical protein